MSLLPFQNMPRFQTLTTGMRVQQSPTSIRTNKFEKAQDIKKGVSQLSVENLNSPVEQKSSWDQEKVSKRKSRLNTTLHLTPKMEISASDRHIVFKEGHLTTMPRKEMRFFTLKNGLLNEFQHESEVYIILIKAQEIPSQSHDISNCFVTSNETTLVLTLLLLEEERRLQFVCNSIEELRSWAKILTHISYRWGLVQKTEMEYELAGMRKQLGQLWDLCVDGIVPAKVQKVKYNNIANQ
jgi:hypothetical protein